MSTIDASAFNFAAMKEAVGIDPFAQPDNKYARDERFYSLQKDKDGNGAALIRFLPDSETRLIQQLYKINSTVTKNGKKRFISEFSPTTIGLACPFQEAWQELWNDDDKEAAKLFSRGVRFVSNIKIIKDPANPENEGKIFLYEMSGAFREKIKNAVEPSEENVALGAVPKELFNPLAGNSYRLVAKKGANGQINYDSSEVVADINSIYTTVEEALGDIKANTHKLADLLKPEAFMTYDELVTKKAWVTFADQVAPVAEVAALTAEVAVVAPVVSEVQPTPVVAAPVVAAQPANITGNVATTIAVGVPVASSLDALLDGLL
jgi:hypothetical protein